MLNKVEHVTCKVVHCKDGEIPKYPPSNIQFSPLHCLLTLKPSLSLYVVVNK